MSDLKDYHKVCFDPFKMHKKRISKSLRLLPKRLYKLYKVQKDDFNKIFVCTACHNKILKEEAEESSGTSEIAPEDMVQAIMTDSSTDSTADHVAALEDANESLVKLNISPIKMRKLTIFFQ